MYKYPSMLADPIFPKHTFYSNRKSMRCTCKAGFSSMFTITTLVCSLIYFAFFWACFIEIGCYALRSLQDHHLDSRPRVDNIRKKLRGTKNSA